MSRTKRRDLGALLALCVAVSPGVASALPQRDIIAGWDAETQAAINDELSTCPECSVEALDDGSPNIVVPPDAHPDATGSLAPTNTAVTPAATTTCVAPRTYPSVARSADYFSRVGNTWFGAYYRAASRSNTAPTRSGDVLYHADVESAVGATVFGFNLDAARGEASADAYTAGSRSVRGRFYARNRYGAMMLVGDASSSSAGNVTVVPAGVNASLWSGTYGFTLGPIPVTVHGELTAAAGYVVNGYTAATQASVTGRPTAGLYALGSITASVGIAALGVDGRITIAEGALPTRASMSRTTAGITHNLGSDVQITLLSGRIDAWVRVGFWYFKKTWRRNLVNYPGIRAQAALYNVTGTLPFCVDTIGGGVGGVQMF